MNTAQSQTSQSRLPRPNVSSIRSLREKIFHNMILFKIILYTVLVLFVNNVFFYKSYLYEWLNVNNFHKTIDFTLLIPRYIFYPLVITCDGTEVDFYMTLLILYNLGKRMEILARVNMKKILLFSYLINLFVNGVLMNYIVSRLILKEKTPISPLLIYPLGSSFLIVSLLSQYKFIKKYSWEFNVYKSISFTFTNNIFLQTVIMFYLINHYREVIPLIIQYTVSLYII